MKQTMHETVQQYIDVATKAGYTPKLQRVGTPFSDCDTPDPDGVKPTGKLSRVAASNLMKALYTARMCRYDLLKAIGHLASRITKWTTRCDKQLNRLISYINTTADDVTLRGYIGDSPDELWLEL